MTVVADPFTVPEVAVTETDTPAVPQYETERASEEFLYEFEGHPVHFTKAKVTSVAGLEIGDAIFRVDDVVRMFVECRVVGIDHKTNDKTGKMERVHLMKAVDSLVVDWGMDIDQLREALK